MTEFDEDTSSEITHNNKWAEEERRAGQRGQISASLDEIVADVAMALADAGMGRIPIYFAVPLGGPGLLSVISPVDPSEDEWLRIDQIVCQIVGQKIRSDSLCGREVRLAAVGGHKGAAVDLHDIGDNLKPQI